MRTYTGRELRSAILIAVVLTSIAMLMLFDRSCRPLVAAPPSASSHTVAP